MDGLLFCAGVGVTFGALPFGGLLGLLTGGLGLIGVLGAAGILGAAGAGGLPAGLGSGVDARLLSAFLASMLSMLALDLNISDEYTTVPVTC
jgi:hypothetical protein